MNESGLLTLAAFVFLGVFAVIAFFSLRRNIRGIELPSDQAEVTAESGTDEAVAPEAGEHVESADEAVVEPAGKAAEASGPRGAARR